MDESTGSIYAVVEVDVQIDDNIETERSVRWWLKLRVCSKVSAEGTLILKESKEEVEDIWSKVE